MGEIVEFVLFIIVMVFLVSIIFYLLMYNKTLSLEKRISKYCVDTVTDNSKSFFDNITDFYQDIRTKVSNRIRKIAFLKRYASRYSKYIRYDNKSNVEPIDFVTNKIFISVFFMLLGMFANIIVPMFSIFQILLLGLFGFFVIDIYFVLYDNVKKRLIERDLLNAIIIMNNAFRSGRSTIQAIEIVSKELSGPIAEEFKKMYLEIGYGLSFDVVFDRFSKRVSSPEVGYITSSLSILNKTGGNIIKVFASIEKMLFNKRKLRQEMKSLTSSSKMISIILLILPIIFILFIFILDNTYFVPLFTNTVGRLIFSFMLLLYFIYIFVVYKIMNVRYYE